jgi:hypothetical protein
MSVSRWLTWTPLRRTIDVLGKHLELELPKPPKMLSEGFGGWSWDSSSISEQRIHKNGRDDRVHELPVTLDPLWGDPCSCGGRDWHRIARSPHLECLTCGRVVYSDYLDKGGTDETEK